MRPEAQNLIRHDLNPDYTTARDPDAANGVPFGAYDEGKAEQKVGEAERIAGRLRRLLPDVPTRSRGARLVEWWKMC